MYNYLMYCAAIHPETFSKLDQELYYALSLYHSYIICQLYQIHHWLCHTIDCMGLAATVGQSHVILNRRTLAVLWGCEENHMK